MWEVIFFKYHVENEAGRQLFVFKKALFEVKVIGLYFHFNIFQ